MDEELTDLLSRVERIEHEDWSWSAPSGSAVRRRSQRRTRQRRVLAATAASVVAVGFVQAVAWSDGNHDRTRVTAATPTGQAQDPAARLRGVPCQTGMPSPRNTPALSTERLEGYALDRTSVRPGWAVSVQRMRRQDVYSMGATGSIASVAQAATTVVLNQTGAAPEWSIVQYVVRVEPGDAAGAFDTLATQLMCDPAKTPRGEYSRPHLWAGPAPVVVSRALPDGAVLAVRGLDRRADVQQNPWIVVARVKDVVTTLSIGLASPLDTLGVDRPGDDLPTAVVDAVVARLRGGTARPLAFPVRSTRAPDPATLPTAEELGAGWRRASDDVTRFSGGIDSFVAPTTTRCPASVDPVGSIEASRSASFRSLKQSADVGPEVSVTVSRLPQGKGAQYFGHLRSQIAAGCSAVALHNAGSLKGIGDDAILLRASTLDPSHWSAAITRVGDMLTYVSLNGSAKSAPQSWQRRVLRIAADRLR